jgi:hypothetical protein
LSPLLSPLLQPGAQFPGAALPEWFAAGLGLRFAPFDPGFLFLFQSGFAFVVEVGAQFAVVKVQRAIGVRAFAAALFAGFLVGDGPGFEQFDARFPFERDLDAIGEPITIVRAFLEVAGIACLKRHAG